MGGELKGKGRRMLGGFFPILLVQCYSFFHEQFVFSVVGFVILMVKVFSVSNSYIILIFII